MPDHTAARVATNTALKSWRGQSGHSGMDLNAVMYVRARKCYEM